MVFLHCHKARQRSCFCMKWLMQRLLHSVLCIGLIFTTLTAGAHIVTEGDKEPTEVELTFDYIGDLLLVKVRLGGVLPLTFIVDTGSPYSVLFERLYVEILGIPLSKAIKIAGADRSQLLEAYIARRVPLVIDDKLSLTKDIIVLKHDYFSLSNLIGAEVDGILGMDIFRRWIVDIDYRKNRITLRKDLDKIKLNRYSTHPLLVYQGKPYVRIPIDVQGDSTIEATFLLDTGAGVPVMLFNASHPEITLPTRHIRGLIGVSLGGNVEGYLARIHAAHFGGKLYQNPIVYYFIPDTTALVEKIEDPNFAVHGILGNKLLSHYRIIFDAASKTLYLRPYSRKIPQFEIDKSGIQVFASGPDFKTFVVGYVIEGSPAWEAGIRSGDQILWLGCWHHSWLTLNTLTKKLSGREGKKIRMKIKRGERTFWTQFRLRQLI